MPFYRVEVGDVVIARFTGRPEFVLRARDEEPMRRSDPRFPFDWYVLRGQLSRIGTVSPAGAPIPPSPGKARVLIVNHARSATCALVPLTLLAGVLVWKARRATGGPGFEVAVADAELEHESSP